MQIWGHCFDLFKSPDLPLNVSMNLLASPAQFHAFTLQQQQQHQALGELATELPVNSAQVVASQLLHVTGRNLALDSDTIATGLIVYHRYLVLQPSSQPLGAKPGLPTTVAALFVACKKSTSAIRFGIDPAPLLAEFNRVVCAICKSGSDQPRQAEEEKEILWAVELGRDGVEGHTEEPDRSQQPDGGLDYEVTLAQLYEAEMSLLFTLQFETVVHTPHSTAAELLTSLLSDATKRRGLEDRVCAFLTDALVATAPALAVLHQPETMAAAAVQLVDVSGELRDCATRLQQRLSSIDPGLLSHCTMVMQYGLSELSKIQQIKGEPLKRLLLS